MERNPLLLAFLGIGVLFLILIAVLVWLQRRMLRSQTRAVRELLEQAREVLAQEREGADSAPTGPADDDDAPER